MSSPSKATTPAAARRPLGLNLPESPRSARLMKAVKPNDSKHLQDAGGPEWAAASPVERSEDPLVSTRISRGQKVEPEPGASEVRYCGCGVNRAACLSCGGAVDNPSRHIEGSVLVRMMPGQLEVFRDHSAVVANYESDINEIARDRLEARGNLALARADQKRLQEHERWQRRRAENWRVTAIAILFMALASVLALLMGCGPRVEYVTTEGGVATNPATTGGVDGQDESGGEVDSTGEDAPARRPVETNPPADTTGGFDEGGSTTTAVTSESDSDATTDDTAGAETTTGDAMPVPDLPDEPPLQGAYGPCELDADCDEGRSCVRPEPALSGYCAAVCDGPRPSTCEPDPTYNDGLRCLPGGLPGAGHCGLWCYLNLKCPSGMGCFQLLPGDAQSKFCLPLNG